jgi:hypothetical protein
VKRLLAAAALLVALACREQGQAPATGTTAPPPPVPSDADERTNLLNMAFGASVVSRTAELTLDHSAIRAIDGDPASGWVSPPNDTEQTIVFALPAPARIDKVGIRAYAAPQTRAKTLTFEISEDGMNFVTAATPSTEAKSEVQLFDIKPATARYLRVTTGASDSISSGFAAVHVRGTLLAEPSVAPIEGCWSINGVPAAFESREGRLVGVMRPSDPIHMEGSADGPVYRFTWSRGPEAGEALVTLSPDGQHLSGSKWYDEPIPVFYGDSWFGERAACGETKSFDSPLRSLIRRRGHYPLYTLQFDRNDALVESSSGTALATIAEAVRLAGAHRVTLGSREFREASPQANLRRSQRRLDSLRAVLAKHGVDVSKIDFQASGSERPHVIISTQSMRVLYSVIDIEVPEAARSLF